jgi:HEAT repeat protein
MWWNLGFMLGGAIVLIVALLLIVILLVARNIRRLAAEALSVAGEIEAATTSIWGIEGANDLVRDTARAAKSIEDRVKGIAAVLEGAS